MRDNTQHLYNNFELRKLLIPIIVEQLLSSLMGTADTMMVSNVGSAAISAVSLVDSINILVIQAPFPHPTFPPEVAVPMRTTTHSSQGITEAIRPLCG